MTKGHTPRSRGARPVPSNDFPPYLQVFFALLVAFILRTIQIDGRALWYDEAFAVLFSEKGLSAMLRGTLTATGGAAADVHPLLYYFTLGGWMRLFGDGPGTVRLYSVLLSLITLLFLYLLTRTLFDHKVGIVALLVAVFAPFAVQYGQESRMYALLCLLLIIATWCFVQGIRHRSIAWWVGFGICAGLAMYTQQLAAFYLIALGFGALATRDGRIIRGMLFGASIAVLIYLPWLLQLPAQLGKLGSYWIERPGLPQLILTLRTFVFVDMDVPSITALIVSLIAALIALVFLFLRAIPTIRRHERDRFGVALLLWLAFAPMLIMFAVSQVRPVYLNRALLPSALMFYCALGWLFTRARLPRPIMALLIAVLGASAVLGLGAFYDWDTFPRGPFRQIISATRSGLDESTGVIHANKLTALPFVYYDRLVRPPDLPQRFIADEPGSPTDTLAPATQDVLGLPADPCIARAARDFGKVVYIKFDRQGDADLPYLRAHFGRERAIPYGDLTVYEFSQRTQPSTEECAAP